MDPPLARLYYRSALTALRHLDERSGRRRFGPDADARWYGFAGDDPAEAHRADFRPRVLVDGDRIDLLLRDADAQWPGAFGARTVFALSAVAEDDAFGAEWTPTIEGGALWEQVTRGPPLMDPSALLRQLAGIWDVPLDLSPLRSPGPSDRWLLRGPGAIASAILAFIASPNAIWHAQVVVVAEPPLAPDTPPQRQRHRAFARQLAALAGALLGQQKPTRLLDRAPSARDYPGHERFGAQEGAP